MKSQWCNSSKCMKAFNICIIKANVKKVPKHVTLLSQRDASSPKQEQVLSSEKKKKIRCGWNAPRPTQLHVSAPHVLLLFLCAEVTCFMKQYYQK